MAVRRIAVFASGSGSNAQAIADYFRNNKNIAVEEIKQHCSLHLALYKIPTIFEISSRSFIKATGKKFIG